MSSIFEHMKALRPYQSEAVSNVYKSINSGKRAPLLQLATAGGKTFIAATIARDALSKGKRVLFIVDAITLSDQTYKSFTNDIGGTVGIIQARHEKEDFDASVTVGTIQSLRAWKRKYPEAFWTWMHKQGVIFIDEAHVLHQMHKEIMVGVSVPVIGLSATPWAKGLGKHFDDLIIGCPMSKLIEDGYLCTYEAYSTGQPDLKGVAIQNGDYKASDVQHRYDGALVANIVQTTIEHAGKDKQIMLMASTVEQSKMFAEMFVQAGVKAEHIDGYGSSPKDIIEKKRVMDRFKSRETQMLCSVNKLNKGFDYPEAEVLVMCRPTKSLMLFIQAVGRVLRIHNSKAKAIVLDFAGNFEALGRPEDINITELSMGEKIDTADGEDSKPKDKPCKGTHHGKPCGFIFKGAICPNCGHDRTPPRGEVEYVEAELVKVDKSEAQRQVQDEYKAGLLFHAQKYEKPDYWAAWQYGKRFKVNKNEVDFTGITPEYSAKVFGWCTYGAQKRRGK